MNRIILSTAIAFALAGVAQAQTGTSSTMPAAGPPTTPKADSNTASSPSGIRMADTATMAVRFVNVEPAAFMASRLIGATVYNHQNDSVGEIQDLVIDDGKTVTGVVVSVGGFLGMGESYVVIDPSSVVVNQRDGAWRARVNTTKDTLKDAPKFTYSKMKK
ncbi:MAG: PRC-barrel domain-containing protein [Burkholderiaceae bacterium]|nr:PRC-barrel domain-containing protein [Burkholderiaceae bacterium]